MSDKASVKEMIVQYVKHFMKEVTKYKNPAKKIKRRPRVEYFIETSR